MRIGQPSRAGEKTQDVESSLDPIDRAIAFILRHRPVTGKAIRAYGVRRFKEELRRLIEAHRITGMVRYIEDETPAVRRAMRAVTAEARRIARRR